MSPIVSFLSVLRRNWHKVLSPTSLFVLAVFSFAALVLSGPDLPKEIPEEHSWAVSVETARYIEARPQLRLYGRLVAGRTAELRALASGTVVTMSEKLREGGAFKQGNELLRIDDFSYQSALVEARAMLSEARARLDEYRASLRQGENALERELEQLELTRTDEERAEELARRGTVSQKFVDDKRLATLAKELSVENRRNDVKVQTSRIAQQEAVIERLESGVRRAERNLEDTVLHAPFNGLVEDVGVAEGRLVSVNDRVANLIDLDNLEARFTLSNAQYARILAAGSGLQGQELEVRWNAGKEVAAFSGVVARAAPRIEAGSGGVDIYVRLEIDGSDTPLRPGAFLEADFPDVVYENVVRVPQSVLYEDDTVYVVADERLSGRKVDVVGADGPFVLLRGDLAAGDAVLASRLLQAGEGVKVRIISQ